jgi:signal transduction histidine kinase
MMLPETKANENIHKHVDHSISTVRNLSYLLHPPLLDETGLRAALHWYVEGLAKRSKIDISLSITPLYFLGLRQISKPPFSE